MTALVNRDARSGARLLDVLAREAQNSCTSGTRTLYAISCYFDCDAIVELPRRIARAVREGGGSLVACEIAVDIADWTRQRADATSLRIEIARATGISEDAVGLHPVAVAGQLVHAKGYAVIGPPLKKSRVRRGFAAITSGNLTQRGLGLDHDSNVEIVHVAHDTAALEAFRGEFMWLIKSHPLSGKRLREHEKFLLALRLLGAGCFFHKWEGNLSSEVAFRITLTRAGKAAARADEALLRDYEAGGETRSRDPINLSRVFRRRGKPLPRTFWKTYSVDTALGRWVPHDIAALIESALRTEVEPYWKAIRARTKPTQLDEIAARLRASVGELHRRGWIKEDEDAVAKWRERVEAFRDRDDLIRARIFNYESVPELLEQASKSLVLQTFEGMRDHLALKRKRLDGLRAIVVRAIEDGADEFEDELVSLTASAEHDLKRHVARGAR